MTTSEKPLQEMSNEELWQLFPIILSSYDPAWPERYQTEEQALKQIIGETPLYRISHIGSTAVPGLTAKPTIDILAEINPDTDTKNLTRRLENAGYIFSPQQDNPPPHLMFMKGYTPAGFRGQAFHLHIRYPADWDEFYFRDYLRLHPETAREYENLKKKLQEYFRNDRDAYTDSKSDFIRQTTRQARSLYGSIYQPVDRL